MLLELPDNASVHIAARLARDRWGEQLVEVVPGHSTLLLVWDEGMEDAAAIESNLKALASDASAFKLDSRVIGNAPPPGVTVPVRYDGADLESVGRELGVSREAVVELHSGAGYTVAFMGFSPGFPYLIAEGGGGVEGVGGAVERMLALPRLETPRTEVVAGSVAVAAGYCGIYPRSSPGGWNLLGRTEVVLFDVQRKLPALLGPGTRVRFESI
ncbi:MAG TPA: carboxyltransferase domain-containing protein [Solirubrobacteraceae bacterium]|nr:carboxyltransferase domain-containing protein [Solirubrobacteraceae bacterium]